MDEGVLYRESGARLERSCGPTPGEWIRTAPARPGLERVEARFTTHAFAPHRHDTYAIGVTRAGVQSFGYRGASTHSVPGQLFVLHPDELHDGYAGTEAGYRYRILYVEPRLIQDALGRPGGPLPFVSDAVSREPRLAAAIIPALANLDRPLEDLHADQIIAELAGALAAIDPSAPPRPISAVHLRAVQRARDFLAENVRHTVTSGQLEAVTGLGRYALAGHFRACYGTSPYRYLVMRRLDLARRLIQDGRPLCEAALASGFADQSHMTRHFRKSYGVSPGRWARMTRASTT